MHQGDKIREARLAKGMSQNDLAVALGVSKPAVSRYELGQRHLPLELAASVSEILGIPIFELFDFEPEKRAELEQAQEILSGIQERELEGQYLSDADQWIYSVSGFLKHLIDRELAVAAVSGGPNADDTEIEADIEPEPPKPEPKPEPEPEPETPEQRKNRKRMNRLRAVFESLNDEGQRRVIELAKDLSCIPAYRQTTLPIE